MSTSRENFRFFTILDGASIANEDQAGDPEYFGYTRPGGTFIIMEHNAANGTYAFALGADVAQNAFTEAVLTKYDAAWANRVNLVYKRAGEFKSL